MSLTSKSLNLKQDRDSLNKIFVVIAASGSSNRFSRNLPKQFCVINGDIAIRRVVRLFLSSSEISGIVCVIPDEFREQYNDIFKYINDDRLLEPVLGGVTRGQSVKNGLDFISKFSPDFVLIHDAARCFCDINLVSRVIDSLKNGARAVIPAINPVDSVRFMSKNINRDEVNLVQTPQGFDFKMIKELHEKYKNQEFSDDASLCDIENIKVDIVEGSLENKKVTYQSDISKEIFKTGFGFDAHRFADNRDLFLMGVKIENHPGLEGVSDADVGIHSLVDAVFGALGIGSIGEHFPPYDSNFKNADSKIFLKYCKDELEKHKAKIVNIDTTIVCESPNISKHSKEMKNIIADCLEIDSSLINIKGKTTEGMGYTGRQEGISACSIVSVKLHLD